MAVSNLGHLPGDRCMETMSMHLTPNSDLQRDRSSTSDVCTSYHYQSVLYYINRLRHPNWIIFPASFSFRYV